MKILIFLICCALPCFSWSADVCTYVTNNYDDIAITTIHAPNDYEVVILHE